MGKWDWLKDFSLVKINLNVDLSRLKSVKLLSDNKIGSVTEVTADENSKALLVKINQDKLASSNQQTQAEVHELLRQAVATQGGNIEEHTDKLIDDVSSYQSKGGSSKTLNKLRKIAPPKDIPIWESALYIRGVYEQDGNVGALKQTLKYRFGDRGGNIANLCTAGYLESVIFPIFDELSKRPDFTQNDFDSQYETIVTMYPFAVFVAQPSSEDEVLQEIKEKIDLNKNYGVSTLNIHTIGKSNIKKVNSVLDNKEISEKFTNPPRITIDGNVLLAVVYY